MKVTLTEMHSIRDAIRTMYMSKRTWNVEIEQQLKEMVDHCTDRYGRPLDLPEDDELKIKFDKEVAKLLKWGQKHITMLRLTENNGKPCAFYLEGLSESKVRRYDQTENCFHKYLY